MRVQRQMVCEQIEVVLKNQRNATALGASEARRLGFPEITMMHQHGIGARCHRGFQQGQRCRDAADNPADLGAPFHLQAVWAIISKLGDFQKPVQVGVKLIAIHERLTLLKNMHSNPNLPKKTARSLSGLAPFAGTRSVNGSLYPSSGY